MRLISLENITFSERDESHRCNARSTKIFSMKGLLKIIPYMISKEIVLRVDPMLGHDSYPNSSPNWPRYPRPIIALQ